MYNNFQKSHRAVSSFPSVTDRKLSPESSKYSKDAKQSFESNDNSKGGALKSIQNQIHYSTEQSQTQQNILSKMRKRTQTDDISKLTIEQLNLQIDNNMNQILFLLNKRRNLINQKKRKLKEQTNIKMDKSKNSEDQSRVIINNDEQMSKLMCFVNQPETASRILNNLIDIMPILQQKKNKQEQKSVDFWNNNKKYQQEIDLMLSKLKQIDFNLQKQTNQVAEICKSLDSIEENLKDLLIKKSEDHLKKAEPLFINKKKTYDLLNAKIFEREKIKDEKIEYVKKIRQYLIQLKMVRENRRKQICELFDIEDQNFDVENKITHYTQCTEAIEELIKLKQKSSELDTQQKQVNNEIDNLAKAEEFLISELMKKQNDQAKAYQNYDNLMKQKFKYNIVLGMFSEQINYIQSNSFNESEYLDNFKLYRQALKGYAEENRLIKQGLVKTNQTYKTFSNILKATENQKQRRKQLLNLVQSCSKLKNDEENKKEQLRNMTVQIAKKGQQRNHIEEQLQNMITDGDLDSYKKVGVALSKCQNQIEKLANTKKNLQSEIQTINRQIVSIATNLKHEFEDILKDILPTNFEFNLKTSDDIKQIKNYLRKTYKRLGLISINNSD